MIKKFVAVAITLYFMFLLITPTGALYEKTTTFQSGDINAEIIESTPPALEYDNIVQIKKNLQVTSGKIGIDTYVDDGPIKLSLLHGSITGTVITNRGVSISGASSIKGPVLRQEYTFEPIIFDYSIVPKDLPHFGDISTSKDNVINSSGQYYNINISTPLTIDTTKNDVIIVANHINMSGDINVIGKHRAIVVVKSNLNVNGHRSINNTTKNKNFDLVVQAWSLSLQNSIQFYGRLYFEGEYLYLRNKIEITGAVFAPSTNVELSASIINGAINCTNLTLLQESSINSK